MRLPYVLANPPTSSDPSIIAAYTQLSARRSPQPLQQLDLALLHSPPVASGWSSFLGSIRTQTKLAPDIRELCICRVAVLNEANYEWEHHVPILRDAGLGAQAVDEEERTKQDGYGGLDEKQRAVLAYTDAMTIGVKVNNEIFGELKRHFDEREVVEITSTVAAYNCVSRFLVALDVGEMNDKKTV
ncbi:4-carboxymuconolactone decarboxylase [Usnea florida]